MRARPALIQSWPRAVVRSLSMAARNPPDRLPAMAASVAARGHILRSATWRASDSTRGPAFRVTARGNLCGPALSPAGQRPQALSGAGEGNRTLLMSLGSSGNATIRRPRDGSLRCGVYRVGVMIVDPSYRTGGSKDHTGCLRRSGCPRPANTDLDLFAGACHVSRSRGEGRCIDTR